MFCSSPAEQAAVACGHHRLGLVAQALRSATLSRRFPFGSRSRLKAGIDEVAGDLSLARAAAKVVEHVEQQRKSQPLEARHGKTRRHRAAVETTQPAKKTGGGSQAQLEIIVERKDYRHRRSGRGAQPEPMIAIGIFDDEVSARRCRAIR